MPTPRRLRGSRRAALGEPRRGALYLVTTYPQAHALKDNKVKNARARVTVFESHINKGTEGEKRQR